MILAFLLGAAAFCALDFLGNRDAAILAFGLATLGVWIREANLRLLAERDRAVALRRMGEWGLLP